MSKPCLHLKLESPGERLSPGALSALAEGLSLLLDAGDWSTRPTVPCLDDAEDVVRWTLQLDGQDRRRTWRELCQSVALARLVSALQPEWVVTVEDATGLWSHSPEAPNPLVLRGGAATRPRRGGPPSPAADRDRALHDVLWAALGEELAVRWGVRPPPPEPDAPAPARTPSGSPGAPSSAAPAAPPAPPRVGPGFDATLRSARVLARSGRTPTLELELDLVNDTDAVLQDVSVWVVLRGSGEAPIGVAELDLPALGPRERRTTRRSEALVHDPADLVAVEVQAHATALARLHGDAPVSWEAT